MLQNYSPPGQARKKIQYKIRGVEDTQDIHLEILFK